MPSTTESASNPRVEHRVGNFTPCLSGGTIASYCPIKVSDKGVGKKRLAEVLAGFAGIVAAYSLVFLAAELLYRLTSGIHGPFRIALHDRCQSWDRLE